MLIYIYVAGESLKVKQEANLPKLTTCTRCGYVSSQEICKACVLLEGLNRGLPRLGIGKSSKVKKMLAANNMPSESTTNLNKNCSNHVRNGLTENVADQEKEEFICDNTDRKCLCRGTVTPSERNSELSITKQLLQQLEL